MDNEPIVRNIKALEPLQREVITLRDEISGEKDGGVKKRKQNELNEKIHRLYGNMNNILRENSFLDIPVNALVDDAGFADIIACKNKGIKSTQLRKFFDYVKQIERDLKDKQVWDDEITARFSLLRPKLAYAKARGLVPDSFFRFIDMCMNKVKGSDDKVKAYTKFIQFLEAIVAYHKYYNPKSR